MKKIKCNIILSIVKELSTLLLPLITFRHITRTLLNEGYGRVNFCNSIINYFAMLAALGIANYAIREGSRIRENNRSYSEFACEVFSINILSMLFAYALFSILIISWNIGLEYKIIMCIQGAAIFFNTLNVEWIYTTFEDYLFITIRSIIVQILIIASVFYLVKTKDDCIKYVAITTGATAIGSMLGFFRSRKYVKLKLRFSENSLKHIVPVLILFANTALASIYLNSDITMLGLYKGDSAVGLYEVTVRVYSIVKGLLNAITLATVPRLAFYIGEKNKDSYQRLSSNIFKLMISVTVPALVGLFMVGKNVILLLPGESYLGGIGALRILCIALLFATSANFFVNVLLLNFRREKTILIATIASATINVLLNFYFIPKYSLNGAAFTTLIAEFVVTIISGYSCRDVFAFKGFKRTVVSIVIGCLGIILCCVLIGRMNLSLWTDTIFKVLASILIYCTVQLIFNREFVVKLIKKDL